MPATGNVSRGTCAHSELLEQQTDAGHVLDGHLHEIENGVQDLLRGDIKEEFELGQRAVEIEFEKMQRQVSRLDGDRLAARCAMTLAVFCAMKPSW